MARYRGPKQKISRRYKDQLFNPSGAFDSKPYPPGQHGKTKRTKLSNYGVQLMEKQKAKHLYGILERQFRRIFAEAARRKGSTGENLIQLLEARLDNAVYRMGFSPSRRGARQLVGHKHITVNGHVVNIPSYQLKPGDVVEVRESSKALESITRCLNSRNNQYPWIETNKQEYSAKFLHYPDRADVKEKLEERLIVELYSR